MRQRFAGFVFSESNRQAVRLSYKYKMTAPRCKAGACLTNRLHLEPFAEIELPAIGSLIRKSFVRPRNLSIVESRLFT